jgi:hypothetical protein
VKKEDRMWRRYSLQGTCGHQLTQAPAHGRHEWLRKRAQGQRGSIQF